MFGTWNKPITSKLLIFGSLTLLLFFLVNWVKNAYSDEKEALQKELAYTFKDVVHSIEDSLVHNVLSGNFTIEQKDYSAVYGTINKKKTIKMDSMNLVFNHDQNPHTADRVDSSIHMIVKTFSDTVSSPLRPGLLPILMNWTGDSLIVELDGEENAEKAVAMITERFDKAIASKNLPTDYKVIKQDHNSNSKGMVVDFYHLPTSNRSYAAEFSNYMGYVVNNIKSNIFFALLLFTAISLSFYLIYFNWREQQKLIEIKNDFISNVTHELKTPISTVSVALEALSNFDVLKDKEKTKDYLQISQKELNRLKILVDKVLKMSIFEKGEAKLQIEELRMDSLLDDVLTSMKIQFEKEKAEVKKEVLGRDFSVEVDKIHLTNVIYNLLDNAIKYCKKTPKINIRLEELKDSIDLYIQDNGIGIDEQDQRKVFNRFFRVPSGDTHNVKGHGLGLSYVASIINQHNGSIELKSIPTEGSTFHIRLKKSYGKN
jgi:signal transduction histidine kinase